jgi:hypothetical protein
VGGVIARRNDVAISEPVNVIFDLGSGAAHGTVIATSFLLVMTDENGFHDCQ